MNVLVTGGGTIAPIDDVRRIVNLSTGRFSAMLSEAFLRHGCRVTHLFAPGAQRPFRRQAGFDLDGEDPAGELQRLARLRDEWHALRRRYTEIPLQNGTVLDYARTLGTALRTNRFDLILLAMAVSDYEPEPRLGKLGSSAETLEISCRRTPKVILAVRGLAPDAYLAGFKLLSGSTDQELLNAAREACRVNRSDATIANDLTSLREGRHEVRLVPSRGPAESFGPGDDLADRLAARLLERARADRGMLT
jgi:phosphopantothenate-cysteine ligase